MGVGGWLLDEDEALKVKLSNFFVTNYATGKSVPIEVYFRFPDTEEVTRKFPHIAIDLIDIQPEATRAHRANGFIVPFPLEQATPAFGYVLESYDFPLPWSLVYQLSLNSRTPRDDRQLQQLIWQMFPDQFGSLDMGYLDGTIRRADLISAVRRDTIDGPPSGRKRLYRNVVTIAVSSEFYIGQIQSVAEVVGIVINYGLILDNVSVPVS